MITLQFFVKEVAQPIIEEVLFRALLFTWLMSHMGFWPGLLISALVDATLHLIILASIFPPWILKLYALGREMGVTSWVNSKERALVARFVTAFLSSIVLGILYYNFGFGVTIGAHVAWNFWWSL